VVSHVTIANRNALTTPDPSSARRGIAELERLAPQGLDIVRGVHPSADGLLNLLPSGEHGFTRSRRFPLQPGIGGFETASNQHAWRPSDSVNK